MRKINYQEMCCATLTEGIHAEVKLHKKLLDRKAKS